MIPSKIIRFLDQHANMGFGGTRDRNLVPSGCRVSAWRLGPDARTLTVLIPDPLSDRIVELLQETGKLAITLEEHPTHETYQLKGEYLRHRPLEPDDWDVVARLRDRLGKAIRPELPDDMPEAYVLSIMAPDPRVAVDIDVHEVYVQTPGPGAGARVYPPAELDA
jgi:hypothetical protein